jgi:subtilisin
VAEMPQEIAVQLRQHPGLIVEPDYLLSYAQPALPQHALMWPDLGAIIPYGAGFTASIAVLGEGGHPIEAAEVHLYGTWWPAQGITDASGRVQLTLFGESSRALRALYVKPKADYWSLWITQPALDPTQENTVFLTPLSHTFPHFPHQQSLGWGQKAMKIDQLPAHYRGRGVKIAVIDSGVATSHQALRQQVKAGYDTLAHNDQTWSQDTLAHGTHTAGIIAGNLDNAPGIRGIAPDAEVHAYKIFPEGRLSNLIDALNLCIEAQIDLINLGLSCAQRSELLEQKIQEAKSVGIACIVAAGNTAGPVQYPASSPHVLAVAAIGKEGEFPQESAHSAQRRVGNGSVVHRDGFFAAPFSCFGPEVAVCAPGVAILSSVPPDNYAVWDGTSIATPHVTGLAALVLAHHPDFQGAYQGRNAQRVEYLFRILKQSAQPLQLGAPHRVGAGLPDALKALNSAPQTATAMVPEEASANGIGAALQECKATLRQVGLL